ncbi:MAG: hypothetical protein WC343_13155 [Bacilli bacterium]|jgi:hypothetical protein
MIKNIWSILGAVLICFILLIGVGIVVYSLKGVPKEVSISILASTLLGIAWFIIQRATDVKEKRINNVEKEIVVMREFFQLDLSNHKKEDIERYNLHSEYDSQRYEEVRAIMDSAYKTVNKIESWIVEGKIGIIKN